MLQEGNTHAHTERWHYGFLNICGVLLLQHKIKRILETMIGILKLDLAVQSRHRKQCQRNITCVITKLTLLFNSSTVFLCGKFCLLIFLIHKTQQNQCHIFILHYIEILHCTFNTYCTHCAHKSKDTESKEIVKYQMKQIVCNSSMDPILWNNCGLPLMA